MNDRKSERGKRGRDREGGRESEQEGGREGGRVRETTSYVTPISGGEVEP